MKKTKASQAKTKSASTPTQATMEITLTVAHVVFGGNAGHGKYFYSFSPDVVTLHKGQSPITIIYSLDKEVGENFQIVDVLTSDAKNQIGPVKLRKKGRSAELVNLNNTKTLIFFSVLIRDEKRGELFSCDPQVGNDPDISPTLITGR
jgi:hypothetical protein